MNTGCCKPPSAGMFVMQTIRAEPDLKNITVFRLEQGAGDQIPVLSSQLGLLQFFDLQARQVENRSRSATSLTALDSSDTGVRGRTSHRHLGPDFLWFQNLKALLGDVHI